MELQTFSLLANEIVVFGTILNLVFKSNQLHNVCVGGSTSSFTRETQFNN